MKIKLHVALILSLISFCSCYAQFGCSSARQISSGFTETGITTPGTGGVEDWNINPSGTSINSNYWDDDTYLFEYTSGATVEQISMTILSRNSWNGIGIFDDCSGTTFSNELDSSGSSSSSNTTRTVSATIAAGNTVYIAVGQWGTPNDLDFDVVSFTATPYTCPEPNTLTTSNITASSADLGWTAGGSETLWDIEWGADGFTQGTGTMINDTSDNPYNLNGLSANTDYEFYVRADCGGGDESSWAGPFDFTTDCAAFSVPFNEDFESSSSSIDCWTVLNENGDSDQWVINNSSSYANSGSRSYSMYTDFNSGNNDDYLITPGILLTGNDRLKYSYRVRSSSEPNDFEVLLSTTGSSAASFTNILVANASYSNTTYAENIVDLSSYSGTVHIAFRVPSGGLDGYYLYIDDVTVEAIPSCFEPTSLTASNITSSSADLGWTAGDSETAWDIEWGVSGFTLGSGTMVSDTSDNPYTLSGLSSDTSYDFYVRADCGGSESAWAGPFNFMTDIACGDTVTGLCYSQINTIEVLASFEATSGDWAEIVFNSGGIEDCCDELIVYDGLNGTGNIIYGALSGGTETDDLSTLDSVVSTTGQISLAINSDGSVTCSSSTSIDPISVTFNCVPEPYVYDAGAWNTAPEGSITSTDNLIIVNGSPSLASNIEANDVTIMNGATLDVSIGSISINGSLINDGIIAGTNMVTMTGNSAQTIEGSGSISRLEINNAAGVSLDDAQFITTELLMSSGTLTTNDNLTLKSDASGTAMVSQMNTANANISGNVTVERFIPQGNRAYRFISATTSGQSIYDAWQEGGNNSNGFGTHITGVVGTVGNIDAASGLDETVSGNNSLYKWDNVAQTWDAVDNTKTENLAAGTFYRLMVRGNRSIDLSDNTATPTDVTLRSTGVLAIGPVTITGTSSPGLMALSNPYQSQVDISAVSLSNTGADIYYWDPTIGGQGAYTTIEISSGVGTNGSASNILEPGQGIFLVQSGAGSTQANFSESDKVSGSSNIGILSTPSSAQYLRLKLYNANDYAAGSSSIDGLMMKFGPTENIGLDFNDAFKFANLDENLSINHGSNGLFSIERRPLPTSDEIINLDLNQYRTINYTFEASVDLIPGLKAYIKDNLNSMMTEIAQGGATTTTSYSFTVDPNNPQSVAADRFQLVFETVTLGLGQDNVGAISIYPNPVTADELTIALGSNLSGQDVQVSVYNSVGQLIRTASENTGSSSMITLSGMDDMANGIYFVSLKGENLEHTEKIVIK